MTILLSVDLASKFSAAVVRELGGSVLWQGDSGGLSPQEWVDKLAETADRLYDVDHMIVEDVPYGISQQGQVKSPLRLQGMLMHAMGDREFYFINPSTWQKDFEGVGRAPKGLTKAQSLKYRVEAATEHCTALGYTAPDLVAKWQRQNPDLKPLKKYTNILLKQETDYRDAFLMNIWLENHLEDYRETVGVQAPYI